LTSLVDGAALAPPDTMPRLTTTMTTIAARAELHSSTAYRLAVGLRLPGIEVAEVEVGSAKDSVAGELIVDTGASITGPSSYFNLYSAPTIVNDGTISGAFELSAQNTIANVGTISGANSQDRNSLSATSIVNDGTISDAGAMSLSGSVTGTGKIVVDDNSSLTIVNTVASGNTITLRASDVLNIYGSIAAPISGFGPSDVIDYAGVATSADYSNGVLTLLNGSISVATLDLTGNYAGALFIAVSAGTDFFGRAITQISVVTGGNTTKAPKGTAKRRPVRLDRGHCRQLGRFDELGGYDNGQEPGESCAARQ
jgi:hypothetical protein